MNTLPKLPLLEWDDPSIGNIKCPGCYIIYADKVCLYVGFSRDVRKRVSRFYRFTYLGKNMDTKMSKIILDATSKEMSFIYTSSKEEARNLEKVLIDWLHPMFKSETTDFMKLVSRAKQI